MGTLSYVATVSLDGAIADTTGDFSWFAPDVDVFDAHLERMPQVSTEILGRRTYDLMRYWTDLPADEGGEAEQEFARLWRDLDVVAASSTMTEQDLADPRHRLTPHLRLDDIARIVDDAPGIVEIFGPTVAAPAMRAGLVDQFRLFVVPTMIGGGLRALPDGIHAELDLVDRRVFGGGVLYLQYERR